MKRQSRDPLNYREWEAQRRDDERREAACSFGPDQERRIKLLPLEAIGRVQFSQVQAMSRALDMLEAAWQRLQ